MRPSATAAKPATCVEHIDHIGPAYREVLTLVERLHRRLLDVIRDELDRQGCVEVNSVQALLLYNIGGKELTTSELRTRGYYVGSDVSYNLKKLTEGGFVAHQRSHVGRRGVRISLTDKGLAVREVVAQLFDKHLRGIAQDTEIGADNFSGLNKALLRLERFWTDQILYRL
jgi:DNA-binding MarR family transcriptional regulator